jgi:hypothetical protein
VDRSRRHPAKPEKTTSRGTTDDSLGECQAGGEAALLESEIVRAESIDTPMHRYKEPGSDEVRATTTGDASIIELST